MKTAFSQNLQEIEVLHDTEGLLITHCRDQESQQDYVSLWCDVDWISRHEYTNHYFTITVTPEELLAYKDNSITTLDLLQRASTIYRCIDVVKPEPRSKHGFRFDGFVDPDGVASGILIKFEDIPDDLLPSNDSYLNGVKDETTSN